MNQVALPTTVADIVEEYERKRDGIRAAIAALAEACTAMRNAATVRGTFVETIISDARCLAMSTTKVALPKREPRAIPL